MLAGKLIKYMFQWPARRSEKINKCRLWKKDLENIMTFVKIDTNAF